MFCRSLLSKTCNSVGIRRMHILHIPMRWGRGDNYAYLITDDLTKDTWIVDPAEPDEVLPVLESMNFNLKAIVNTHHHNDHSSGNKTFAERYNDLPIIAGKDSPLVSYIPKHGEIMQLGSNIAIKALHTPCHTQDSICYFVVDKATHEKLLISGDTLFTSGCGRFFEGTGLEMDVALNEILASLPDDTFVYPGHEYSRSSIEFSLKVMPTNNLLLKLLKFMEVNEVATGKFTIKDEKAFNPFMRVTDPEVIKYTNGLKKSSEIIDFLRTAKNNL